MKISTGFIEATREHFDDVESGWLAGAADLLPFDDACIEEHDWSPESPDGRVFFVSQWGGNVDVCAGWLRYVDADGAVTSLTTPGWYHPTITVSSSKEGYLFIEDLRCLNGGWIEVLAEDYLNGTVSRSFLENLKYYSEGWNESLLETLWMNISRGEAERLAKQAGVPGVLLQGAL